MLIIISWRWLGQKYLHEWCIYENHLVLQNIFINVPCLWYIYKNKSHIINFLLRVRDMGSGPHSARDMIALGALCPGLGDFAELLMNGTLSLQALYKFKGSAISAAAGVCTEGSCCSTLCSAHLCGCSCWELWIFTSPSDISHCASASPALHTH